ncbi:MAG: T9SS type A sorting domain-containing protein [Saprospiraceae bacterium]|nr:T9SS type A sorting domain-containing protein [Saprospiraceae bacterium]
MNSVVQISKFLLCLCFLFAFNQCIEAQLNHEMIFRVNSPGAVAGDYNFGSPADGAGQWGPTSINTITGDLGWITDNIDSLGCNPGTNNLTGKVALVRRGACNFSLKAYHAQQTGAIGCVICNNIPGGGLVGMTGGDSMSAVNIPIVFLTYEDCELLHSQVDSGNTTNVSFYVPSAYNARSAYAYNTPVQHIQPFGNMSINVYNSGSTPVNNIDVTATISDPNGVDTTFMQTISTLNSTTDSVVTFPETYTPVAVGTYNIVFKTTLNVGDSVVQQFLINNDSTFALDNNVLSNSSTLRGVGPNDVSFADPHPVTGTTFQYGMGACYVTGIGTSDYVSSASFAIANANDYYGKIFLLLLYEAPVNYFAGNETDFSTFNEIGAGYYMISANDTLTPHSILTTNIYNASTGALGVQLQADRQYMMLLRHDGDGSVTTSPKVTSTHTQDFLSVDATVYTDRLYMGGWTGNYMPVIRMHVQPTITGLPIKTLDPSEFMLFPNPTNDNFSVKINLNEVSENINIKLFNLNGKEIQSYSYNNVKNDVYHYNVCELPSGIYLIHVQTDFAQTIRKLIVK